MLVAQGRRYAVEICNTYNLNRMFVICGKSNEVAYFIYQKNFSNLHGFTDKYSSHKDMIGLVLSENVIRPIPQLDTVTMQIQILDLGSESDLISAIVLGRFSVSMTSPPEVCKIGRDDGWGFKEGSATYIKEVPLEIASKVFNRNISSNPISSSSPILGSINADSHNF